MRLWSWGMKNADKSGKLIYANEDVIEKAIGNVTTRDTSGFAEALFKCGWLDRVGNDIYIHDWDFWQKEWYKSQERREADRTRYQNRKNGKKSEDDDPQEPEQLSMEGMNGHTPEDHPNETPTPQPPDPPKTPQPKQYSSQFEELWGAYYGEKGVKAEAYKSYNARLKDGWTHQQLLQAVLAYAAQEKRNGTEPKYVKRVKTFLGPNTPFIDFLPNRGSLKREDPPSVRKNPFEEYEEDR